MNYQTAFTITAIIYFLQTQQTNKTYLVIDQNVEGVCQPHSFTVTAENEAGNSSTTTIYDSIPICELYCFLYTLKFIILLPLVTFSFKYKFDCQLTKDRENFHN